MLSKLDAINEILTSVGETAALTLVAGAGDTTNAEVVLDSETRKVLAKGYEFNTTEKFVINPDGSGRILVPSDALFIDPVDESLPLAERAGVLVNRETGSDIIGKPVTVRIIRLIPFDQCPYHVQRVIVARAAQKYQRSYVGSAMLDRALTDERLEASSQSEDAEADADDYNVLDNAPGMWAFRRRTYGGVL